MYSVIVESLLHIFLKVKLMIRCKYTNNNNSTVHSTYHRINVNTCITGANFRFGIHVIKTVHFFLKQECIN